MEGEGGAPWSFGRGRGIQVKRPRNRWWELELEQFLNRTVAVKVALMTQGVTVGSVNIGLVETGSGAEAHPRSVPLFG